MSNIPADCRERIDDTSFPLVKSAFPQRLTGAFINRYFAWLRRQAERGPFVLLADVRPLDTATADAGLRAAFFAASDSFDRDVGPAHYLGEAVIVSTALQRALLSAYMWFISDATYPTRVFRNETEAERWCNIRLTDAGAAQSTHSTSSVAARGQDG